MGKKRGPEPLLWLAIVCFFVSGHSLGTIVGKHRERNRLTRQIADGVVVVEKHTFGDGRTEYRIVPVKQPHDAAGGE